MSFARCCCCGRQAYLTFHHLIPKKMHRRKRFQKQFSREELNRGIEICRQCHNAIHRFYDEMQLARDFNSLERLLTDEKLSKHFEWISKQKISG